MSQPAVKWGQLKRFLSKNNFQIYSDGGDKLIAKERLSFENYLNKDELESLGLIVNAYLDLAEERAKRKIPMTMEDWSKRLDLFLEFDEREILQDAGTISAEIAKNKAETEFEKYRIVQDHLFENDFDKMLKHIEAGLEDNNSD